MDHPFLIEVRDLSKWFPIKGGFPRRTIGHVQAVEGASLNISRGEVLGLVGESGSGKTTLGRLLLRLIEATRGVVLFNGTDLKTLSRRELRAFRKMMQIVFQDPYSSLNPHLRVGEAIREGLIIHGLDHGVSGREDRLDELLGWVGLPVEYKDRFPHEFSGGQRQRIGIARALAVNPMFLVADEAVSALDVSVKAQIINLLMELQRRLSLTMLFITHDLMVARHISDRIAVMYLGHIVEIAPTETLFMNPRHPYTQALLHAIPHPDPEVEQASIVLKGDIPSPVNPPSGCVFRTRCPCAIEECAVSRPPLIKLDTEHHAACIRSDARIVETCNH